MHACIHTYGCMHACTHMDACMHGVCVCVSVFMSFLHEIHVTLIYKKKRERATASRIRDVDKHMRGSERVLVHGMVQVGL
jgi:hypothetical protein